MKQLSIILSTLFLSSGTMLAQDTIQNFSLGNDTSICLGEYIVLSALLPLSCNAHYLWNDGFEEAEKFVTKSGTYWVDVVSTCGTFRDTIHIEIISCHPGCASTGSIAGIYSSPIANVLGKSLVATPEKDGFYVAGNKDDSVFISKVDLSGMILWTRTFEIVPGGAHFVNSIVIDQEGILAIAGTFYLFWSGTYTGFMFRYDPSLNQILWAKEYNVEYSSVCLSMNQKPSSGNYLLSHDTGDFLATKGGGSILDINKNTGEIEKIIAKDKTFLNDFVISGNYIYGAGGHIVESENFTRQALVKMRVQDGFVQWAKAGERYAQIGSNFAPDLLIDQNGIYSIYSNQGHILHIQKTSLDGDLVWLKQYEIPGRLIIANEIIKSEDGFIIYAENYDTQELVLFKIDTDGNILWARTYYILTTGTYPQAGDAVGQVIELANQIVFTSTSYDSTDSFPPHFSNLLIGRTNLTGNAISSCINQRSIIIQVHEVSNPTFFSVSPGLIDFTTEVRSFTPVINESNLITRESCIISDTIFNYYATSICEGEFIEGYSTPGIYIDTFLTNSGCDSVRVLVLTSQSDIQQSIDKNICIGSSFEGYSASGIYVDTFNLPSGCDSIRTLRLDVISCTPIVHYDLNACQSVMANGSHMDYSEFIPAYPSILACADVSADHLSRFSALENKHSCTPGINNFPAMCVNTLNSCEYLAGHTASVVMEFSIDPDVDSIVQLTGLEFYERSPMTYSWINGPSGPNNYPTFYGIRILKNDTEIFSRINIQTNSNWTFQSFDFINDNLFRVEENSVFRIELLPYCPVGNGADVSAWDIDEIKIFGGCLPVHDKQPVIKGKVYTKDNLAITGVEMQLAEDASFVDVDKELTDEVGSFVFDSLRMGNAYYVKGNYDDDVLNGVSTLDLVYMQKHLLGMKPFADLYQFIAADINHNGYVSAIDLIELRKLILGIYPKFPQNTSWRFGSMPQEMNGSNISQFREMTVIEYLETDTQVVDFVGIKVGDLSGDVKLQTQSPFIPSREDESFQLLIEDKKIRTGESFSIDFKATDGMDIAGMQFSLDLMGMEFISMTGISMPISSENYSLINGILRFSFNQEEVMHISPDDILFSIVLKPWQSGWLSDRISNVDDALLPEVYLENLEVVKLALIIKDQKLLFSESNFLKIEPNPASSETNIHFYLQEGGIAEIRFFDLSGRVVHVIQKTYLPGENTERIRMIDLRFPQGVVYCQLLSKGFTGTEKFINLN